MHQETLSLGLTETKPHQLPQVHSRNAEKEVIDILARHNVQGVAGSQLMTVLRETNPYVCRACVAGLRSYMLSRARRLWHFKLRSVDVCGFPFHPRLSTSGSTRHGSGFLLENGVCRRLAS